ncbi:hypothetical protein GCM10007170_21250 [Arthrobacter liuii]|uniref:EngC GTPase domain-containing protein n=1 Tax=Arthrobacter liuii TaxID=1476996 RepID=A0ABQ2AT16_9MICC|nr:hypothetical protein GCM10007170_21250 [Arthrobacter liuii]
MELNCPPGAGKSTLINALVGREVQPTGEVRSGDFRGKHTTTARELVPLANGTVLMDTPGVRGFGLFDVRDAIDSGALAGRRWNSYLKIQRELAALARRSDVAVQRAYHREWHQKVVTAGKSQRWAEREASERMDRTEGKDRKRKR